ncbi:MAG TPA: LacI family DNA-binding transcriptional regulator [Sphingomicrobium sp.]|nr:LacI family DNA-binding transcriptional regulator [Sphingomicrobium sp.]
MANATIRDVARQAHVSVASVSRVLNGREVVSEETRERVIAAVKALGYVPHAGARSLSLARTHAIGVALPDLHGEFFSEIVRGMDAEARARGYLLILSNLHSGSGLQASALRAMRGRVDGLVVMAPHLSADELAAVLPPGLPAVLVNTSVSADGHPAIHLDNGAGAAAVADHLAGLGRRRIVYIGGPKGNIDAEQRVAAFTEALGRYPDVEVETVAGDFTQESGEAATDALLKSGHRFEALFAANDDMAIGAMQVLRRAGLRVPEDVAVAGFDDIPLARHVGLTTVRVRIAELGAKALARLFTMLEQRAEVPAHELHSPELVVRSTTGDGGSEQ